MSFVIPEHPVASVDISGTEDRFPVRRIYCIGRNYLAHRVEMGNDDRKPPFFFQKPADALVANGGEFPYPPQSDNVHHEIELVVAIGKGGKDIAVEDALDHVYGYALGIDMTRRDQQSKAKADGKPWEAAKGFDHSAPIATIRPVSEIGHPDAGRIWLSVNGESRQDSDLNLQIWNVQEGISHLSKLFEVMPGDLIYTGTPDGVGPVTTGDVMTGGIDGIGEIEITVV
ncbi:MAG: fumarylacetoacetate hydrolase family protein [Rhodospirillaceae bacterium]|jgi:fumarylpyruvate hydrolase|nr:fumarylacetoacetate hydrolase family protein [Rhodospirillaceae bacterium]MBT5243378.1 fumarylacetoacetate hydrolase family protein [Rhodospirillaceae bacterium]MBT5561283.1 fumarylacetoacetate hydrolase family protein [Rhodospirillaceae bacterium]MBT6243358.1 fumarylacetoacetate hydrolase family protein [Rhodospirillaceae bacterium]MBT7139022.1 fumarylacetoacetate hydrolase family protein [Rhodospirillaceae bacterium]